MGSLPSRTAYTRCQPPPNNNRNNPSYRDDGPEVVTPRVPDYKVFEEHPPKFRRLETFEEKFYRKFSEEPLVPIGLVITSGFLINGIRAFYKQNRMKQQVMMRGRVLAQFCTIIAIMFYASKSGVGVDWRLAPLHQDSVALRKKQEEEQERQQAAAAGTTTETTANGGSRDL